MLRNGRYAICTFLIVLFFPTISPALSPKEIYQQVGPGVVLIMGTDGGMKGSGGTGSIIRSDGLVITNAHVVISKKTKRPYKKINVFLKPARVTGNMNKDLTERYQARLLEYDSDLDLALLKIENSPKHLNVVLIGNPEEVSIGDSVVAIGHPETGGLWTLTTGAVSAEIENFRGIRGKHIFQTETSFNRGNSGGPLLDRRGYMVGINTSISRRAADGLTITDINFSVKSGVARDWLSGKGISVDFGPATLPAPLEFPSRPPVVVPKPSRQGLVERAVPEAKPPVKAESTPSPQMEESPSRPYDLDRLIADQMKEMEDLMDEMKGKFRGRMGE